MAAELHLRAAPASDARPRTMPPPQASALAAPFSYAPSDDGTDENLLVMLHGLGDTHAPFGALARGLKLPQTATLALRAPEQIPYLYEPAFQWYPSFDALGELLAAPDPTPALDYLARTLAHLVRACGWPPARIHLFGFAQGGSVAAEAALRWWQAHGDGAALGSVVSVGGPLLSYPARAGAGLCPTPVLAFHRAPPGAPALPRDALPALRRAFSRVVDVRVAGEGMPRARDEWRPIMELWSERLGRRQGDGLYEVMTGAGPT
ncbi:hypothetical protein BC834DRAFT_968968 [Gloeopeniophorella convolvens]|nr:hypothetical protein BC834DRAFT_968968 [Gloeopeniophorella convolvens]